MSQDKTAVISGRVGFTLVELLVVIAIIGVLGGRMLPPVQAARESGRRTQCINQVRQIALALQNYHSAHNAFPATHSWLKGVGGNRWSAMMQCLPFMEQDARYEAILSSGLANTWTQHASLQGAIATLMCPSDGGGRSLTNSPTNYGFSCGDFMYNCGADSGDAYRRMPMSPHKWGPGSRIGDGLSNTVAVSEYVIATEPSSRLVKGGIAKISSPDNASGGGPMGKCGLSALTDAGDRGTFKSSIDTQETNHPTEPQQTFRGGRFYDGRPSYAAFHTVTPPNSPACAHPTTDANGDNPVVWLMPPTSNHPGGVVVAMFDVSTRFVSDSIDCAGATAGQRNSGESPYGVWGAIGSANGKETKTLN